MFYRVERIYSNWGEGIPNIPSTVIVSGCQTFNILTILPIVATLKINNWLLILIFILLYTLNELYTFSSKKRVIFVDNWKNEKMSKKRMRGILIIIYIIGSITLFICSLEWYTGYANWKWEF